MVLARLRKVRHANGKEALEGQTHRPIPEQTMLTLAKEDGRYGGSLDTYVLIELGARTINTSRQSVLSFHGEDEGTQSA